MATSKKSTRSPALRRKAGNPAQKPRAILEDDDDDAAELPIDPGDPLAVEPLSAEEIRGLESHRRGVSEQREAALEVLRKGTEAKLPFDPDDADSTVEATDQRLEVHLRPKHKR